MGCNQAFAPAAFCMSYCKGQADYLNQKDQRHVPPKPTFIRSILTFWRRRWLSAGRRRAIFEHIYDSNRWQNDESRSGHGSSLDQTASLRQALPGLLNAFEIHSIIDVPCGDFHWMKRVELHDTTYLGLDIVPELIAANRARYAKPGRDFNKLDIVETVPPRADLILCRDLLVHLSYADIRRAVANFKASGATYLLTTTFPDTSRNENILTGNWRRLNLARAPFDFPEPDRLINENCTEDNGAYRDKSLGLWKIASL